MFPLDLILVLVTGPSVLSDDMSHGRMTDERLNTLPLSYINQERQKKCCESGIEHWRSNTNK